MLKKPWVYDKHNLTFRIWNDNRGVFALNPQSVTVNENYLDFFIIQKESANPISTKLFSNRALTSP